MSDLEHGLVWDKGFKVPVAHLKLFKTPLSTPPPPTPGGCNLGENLNSVEYSQNNTRRLFSGGVLFRAPFA